VRKRLPSKEREILELGRGLFHVPFHWIHSLPNPKDAITVLYNLQQIPPEKRVCQLAFCGEESDFTGLVEEIADRGRWTEKEFQSYHNLVLEEEGKSLPREKLTSYLDGWARAKEIGEKYPEALRIYQEVFFAEEEKRIQPVLKEALERARKLSEELDLPDLLEELSQGLRFTELPEVEILTLVPSFWVTPLMFFGSVGKNHNVWVFGARPADQSLVPGETVPDALLRALKALSDPTRLKILHYLSQEPLSPATLSRKLRLRAPTVTHHLQTLRLAGLVQVTIGHGKEKKSFAARTEVVKATCKALETFLLEGMSAESEEE